jgi:hypothetical protein
MGTEQSPVEKIPKMRGKTQRKSYKMKFGRRPFCHENSSVFQYSISDPISPKSSNDFSLKHPLRHLKKQARIGSLRPIRSPSNED